MLPSGLPFSRPATVAALVGAAAVVPAAAYVATAGHHLMLPPAAHVVVVGAAGLLAALAALALSVLAARLHDGRTVLLGFAFSVMATMLVVHAIATPGAFMGANGVVQLAGALNIPVGGLVLAASALPALRRPHGARRLLLLQLGVVAVLVAGGVVALAFAGDVPVLPRPGGLAGRLVFVASAAALTLLAWRTGRTFLLTRRTGDLLVTVGVVWLAGAQYGLLEWGMMDLGWWVAHGFEVAGIGLVGIPAALDLRHGTASRPLVGDLRAADLVEHEAAFLGPRVRALLVRLGEQDPSTEGHTRRVAALAVAVGEQLGLPEARLRRLALGGLLHDMGKLSVPREVLQKPGRLTDAEFAVIRRHPDWGRELLTELGGFPAPVLDLVEHHHERLDGAGYPHGAHAAELALEVRVLTVADVYDALTADRVYREAWPASRALALLHEDTGTAFDVNCVRALEAVVAAPEPVAGGWALTPGGAPVPVA